MMYKMFHLNTAVAAPSNGKIACSLAGQADAMIRLHLWNALWRSLLRCFGSCSVVLSPPSVYVHDSTKTNASTWRALSMPATKLIALVLPFAVSGSLMLVLYILAADYAVVLRVLRQGASFDRHQLLSRVVPERHIIEIGPVL
jgi:hypothetical protein